MSSQLVSTPGARPNPVPNVRGVVVVRERVINRVVREASAAAIGVSRHDVDVDVTEWGGGLTVRVAAKLPVPDLEDAESIRSSPSIVERVRSLQLSLASQLTWLTGRYVKRVAFAVTGASFPERKRVQ